MTGCYNGGVMSNNGNKPDHDALADAIARALAPQFNGIRAELSVITGRLDLMTGRFDQMTGRLDQIVENTGSHYRRLEDRISRLETKVFSDDDKKN